jgi:Rad3-related DNA helicase
MAISPSLLTRSLCFVRLTATGPDVREDSLIAIDAAAPDSSGGLRSFSTLVKPERRIPLAVMRRTGISGRDVDAAPYAEQALNDFLDFAGPLPCAALDGPSTEAFLRRLTGGLFTGEVVDVSGLARLVRPLGPEPVAADAAALADEWARLMRDLAALPFPVLAGMARLLGPRASHPFRSYIDSAYESSLAAQTGLSADDSFAPLFAETPAINKFRAPAPDPAGEIKPVDPDEVSAHFAPGGGLAREISDFEERPEQMRMACAVAEAFNDGACLMVEAGTGTGKSVAYLLPAAAFAARNGEKVVVSTHTKNLQSQLMDKDLPRVARALGDSFTFAELKGRRNYLCARKFLNLLHGGGPAASPEERAALLPLAPWAAVTKTGDFSELSDLPEAAMRLVTSSSEECLGRKCPNYARCFVYRARGAAHKSDLVVVNHALLFSEDGEGEILPPYRHLILDEAHNVEDAATERMSVRASRIRLNRILNRLWRGRARGDASGLLADVLFHVDRSRRSLGPALTDLARRLTLAVAHQISESAPAIDAFFDSTAALFKRGAMDRIRYRGDARNREQWAPVVDGRVGLTSALGHVCSALEALLACFDDLETAGAARSAERQRELSAQLAYLREFITDVDFLVEGGDARYVYWLEGSFDDDGPNRCELAAAPVDIGPLLAEQMYSRQRALIMTSATLTVRRPGKATARELSPFADECNEEDTKCPVAATRGLFDFVSGRVGFDRLPHERRRELLLGTPFDFPSQCLMLVPNFLPEPDQFDAKFDAALAELCAELFSHTRGRAMALFTSYKMLDRVEGLLRGPLDQAGISMLAQGRGMGRERMLETFADQGRLGPAVLLGTASFWEGVDVKGPALSVLVLAKLPFPVFKDPIIQARSEAVDAEGSDSFNHYLVPQAVIKLRQGFGRLIRSKTDRGVVVLADKRVLTRRYGGRFLDALPVEAKTAASAGELVSMAGRFLGEDRGQNVEKLDGAI